MESGDAIGDWVVIKTLGRGGMGTVFLCHHRSDPDDLAALKIFPAWSTDADGFKRFEREIDVLTRLRHKGIVPLKRSRAAQGRDTASGVYWIAMEYVDGPSLEARLDQGPLAPGYAASVFHTLADAMSYAHAQGVFHRDIKPANIVLGRDGVRLVDFGIALQRERTRLTAVGTFAGTLAYMPPEVVVDEKVHPNPMMGDIYALGVVLYEALTAQRAFSTEHGLSDRARQMRILKAKMKADALDPGEGVPPTLRRAVLETTNPDPATRLSHWGRFLELMEAVPFAPDDRADSVGAPAHDEDDRTVVGDPSDLQRRPVARPVRGRLVRNRRGDTPRPVARAAPLPQAPEPAPEEPTEAAAWRASEPDDSGFTDVAGAAEPEPVPAPPLAPVPAPSRRAAPTIIPDAEPELVEDPPRPVEAYRVDDVPDEESEEATAPVQDSPLLDPGLDDDVEEPTVPPTPAWTPPPPPAPRPSPVVSRPAPVAAAPPPSPVVAARGAVDPLDETAPTEPPKAVVQARRERPLPPPAVVTAPAVAQEEEEPSGGGAGLIAALIAGTLLALAVAAGLAFVLLQPPDGATSPATAPAAEVAATTTAGGGAASTEIAPTELELGGAGDGVVTWEDTGLKQAPLAWPEPPAAPVAKERAAPAASRKTTITKTVRFTSTTAAATVYLNGRRRGETPLTLVLDAGDYEVRMVGAEKTVTKSFQIGKFSADEYQFNEARREIKPRFN